MTGASAVRGSEQFKLRNFRRSDRGELLTLNRYGLEAAGIDVVDDYYAGEDLQDLEATYSTAVGGILLVGEIGARIVAMGGIRRIDGETCELLRMRVYPEHQGRGYGTAILRQLEQESHQLGYRQIELITGEEQHPAVDIYLRNGYRITQRETLIGIPSVHMRKAISESPGRA